MKGCGGNENNFETLENCNKVCQKQASSRSSSSRSKIINIFLLSFKEFKAKRISAFIFFYVTVIDPCELPGAVTGPCRGRIDRFYFDSITKKCEKFNYGGCMGNENNFETVDQCNAQCLSY